MPRNLSIGTAGDDVVGLQRLLNYHLPITKFPPLAVDGKFGPLTRSRVMQFQRLNKNYPAVMPIKVGNGVVKKPLAIDGIVGPNTGTVLLDVRTVTLLPQTNFTPEPAVKTSTRGPSLNFKLADGDSSPVVPPLPSPPTPTPPTPPAPPPPPLPARTIQFLTLQAGGQAQLNPWAIAPFVLTGQISLLARNEGKADVLLTAGAQFAANLGPVNGTWSGQVFGQMGLGNLGFGLGPLDFVNPFVQLMLSRNQGQPFTAGLALGNQVNFTLSTVNIDGIDQPQFSVFFNLQGVMNVGMNNGRTLAPSLQGLLGLAWLFDARRRHRP